MTDRILAMVTQRHPVILRQRKTSIMASRRRKASQRKGRSEGLAVPLGIEREVDSLA